MQKYNCSGTIIISIALFLCYIVNAGPARSLALATVQRGSKIPRSIRAPFRNTEIMTARGFGKRSSSIPIGAITLFPNNHNSIKLPSLLFNSNNNQYDEGWNYGKRETKFYLDEQHNNDANNENFEEIFNEQVSESNIPIVWLAEELASNPGLIRAILYKFVDTNKDGLLSSQELMIPSGSTLSSTSSSNGNIY